MTQENASMGIIWKGVFALIGVLGLMVASFGSLVLNNLETSVENSAAVTIKNNAELAGVTIELKDYGRRLDGIEAKLH